MIFFPPLFKEMSYSNYIIEGFNNGPGREWNSARYRAIKKLEINVSIF